jgi:O-acetyl-ADP-ribose deacetylase (regulator of RNase III)
MMRAMTGDITKLAVDAIINAANTTLLGGGGVDGAIHRAAGRSAGGVPHAGRLRDGRGQIHEGLSSARAFRDPYAGAVWHGGDRSEAERLAACYRNSLALAVKKGCRSVAFPCISTGVYGYPKEAAARIAVETARAFLSGYAEELDVVFCCFYEADCARYRGLLS